MQRHERREFQRLKLSKPILATTTAGNALVLDIGLSGAFLEHHGTVEPGDPLKLTFRWQGADVEFDCEVARSVVVQESSSGAVVSHTGVHFLRAIGDSAERLQDLMGTFVARILEAQKANASGDSDPSAGATILARLGDARRMRSRGYVCHRLENGEWTRTESESPRQPVDGFTVGVHEEEEEVERLQTTYEQADEAGRDLIRLVAELSLRREQ